VVLASTAHVQIVFQLSYTAATVMTRYTGAGCAGEKRGEEKRGSLSLCASVARGASLWLSCLFFFWSPWIPN